uniref:putative reverse transcriptase/maturase n=1 Tax=Rhodospora sordida TaxID=362230 RepID=UPI001FCD33DB|nr:putative reverse transcriptase/maturase [Rhodospora sordida]UNJ15062.1 putative reverse transcriptase/maturase [Rhodospora sordida]
MGKTLISWDILAWDQIQHYVLKFQRKIYCASLLKEKSRVKFLQDKLLKSQLFSLWTTQQIVRNNQLGLNCAQKYEIFFELKSLSETSLAKISRKKIVIKGQIFLLKLVLLPEWDASFRNQQFNYCISIPEIVQNIQRVCLKKQFSHFFEVNLSRYINDINFGIVLNQLNSSLKIKLYISQLLQSGLLENYRNFITYRYFTVEGTHRLDIQLSNLLIDIVFHEFSQILFKYTQKRNLLFSKFEKEGRQEYQYLRSLYSFVILHSEYDNLKEIQHLLTCWLKTRGIYLKEEVISIQSTNSSFNFAYYSFQKIDEKNFQIKPSISAQKHLLNLISAMSNRMKNSPVSVFISKLSLVLKRWKNYFSLCNCKRVFNKLDEQIFQKIRGWAFRRHPKWSKNKSKIKYFPKINGLKYYDRIYSGNWIFSNISTTEEVIILDKLRWVTPKSSTYYCCFDKLYRFNYLYQYGMNW